MSFLLRNPKRNGNNNDRIVRKPSAPSAPEAGRIIPRPQPGLNRRKQSSNVSAHTSKQRIQSSGGQLLIQRQANPSQKQQVSVSQQRNTLKSQVKTRTAQTTAQAQVQEASGIISMEEGKALLL